MESILHDAVTTIDPSYITRGMGYEEYRRLIDSLLIVGRSTAQSDSEKLAAYSRLNVARMNRLDKTTIILPEVAATLHHVTSAQTWAVLTEGWCGDAAQIIPVLHRMSVENPLITLKLLLRDENTALMDQFLANGKSRSIPKLIALNSQGEVLFTFGPRPAALQQLFYERTAAGIPAEKVKEEVHAWYAADKTSSIQLEIRDLLQGVL